MGLLDLRSDGGAFHLVVDLFGAAEGGLHVGADIFRAHYFFELGLMNQAGGLFARYGENEGSIVGVKLTGNFLDGEKSGGIKCSHVAKTQNHHRRQRVQVLSDRVDFVGGAKQKRSVDAEDGGIVRNVLVLEDVHAAVFDVLVGDLGNGWGGGNAADEKKCSEDHAGFNSNGEVGEDGECESDEPDADVGFRELQQLRDLAPLSHVVGDDQENPCEHGQRHVPNQGRGEKQNAEQREGVNHARDRRLSARPNIGGGAGDGAGGGQSAQHGRDDVGHALADQFDVGIVAGGSPSG